MSNNINLFSTSNIKVLKQGHIIWEIFIAIFLKEINDRYLHK